MSVDVLSVCLLAWTSVTDGMTLKRCALLIITRQTS